VLLNPERGRPSVSPPIGERETKPWGTMGAGARRYATIKDMPKEGIHHRRNGQRLEEVEAHGQNMVG